MTLKGSINRINRKKKTFQILLYGGQSNKKNAGNFFKYYVSNLFQINVLRG